MLSRLCGSIDRDGRLDTVAAPPYNLPVPVGLADPGVCGPVTQQREDLMATLDNGAIAVAKDGAAVATQGAGRGFVAALLLAFFSITAPLHAQTGGTIGGVVRDTSGAILPGVTVEASSAALIEKVRSAVTDSDGVYKIVNLQPGNYSVTFTLTGFNIVRREGIELAVGVTATVNADMPVGTLEETVTVSGQAPLVDVQSTTQHRTLAHTLLEDLPIASRAARVPMVNLIPGVSAGGNTIHGSLDQDLPMIYDGMRYAAVWGTAGGSSGAYSLNPSLIEEVAVDTAGGTAENEVAGVVANIIPKQGGNTFSGYLFVGGTNDSLQGTNIDDELRARGARNPALTTKAWDFNPAFGGPIKKDKVWFYGSFRYAGSETQLANAFRDSDPNDFAFTPDLNRPFIVPEHKYSETLRLTWQTTPNSKLALHGELDPGGNDTVSASATQTYEAAYHLSIQAEHLFQATWNWTATNKLLIELGQTVHPERWEYERHADVPANYSGVVELGTGVTFRAPIDRIGQNSHNYDGKVTMSYVTGSHHLKVGTHWYSGSRTQFRFTNNDSYLNLLNGSPVSVTLRATPLAEDDNVKLNLGTFAQEQWTLKRLTLNMGVRFDYLNAYIPEQQAQAVQYVPARAFPQIDNLPNWKNVSPRLGASYDLFGTSRTALKFTLGKYLESQGVGVAQIVNPMLAPELTTNNRAWTDANGNYVPDCDFTNPAISGECGPSGNVNFGKGTPAIRYAPNTVTGWNTRGSNWELSTGVQHQLRSGLSVDASYHRRQNANFRVTDNLLVSPADYDPYCVTVPTDSRLPGGGGQSLCGLYDITPTKFGVADTVVTLSNRFGKQSQIYDGVDVVFNGRLPGRVTFQGGTNTGRTAISACYVIDSPQALVAPSASPAFISSTSSLALPQQFCRIAPPFLTQIKFFGVYPLPWWGLQASAAYQSYPGPEINATYPVANALVAQSLGRDLSGGAQSVTVQLNRPGTMYGTRQHQVDFRIGKVFSIGQARLRGQLDLFNLLNGNTITSYNARYGPAWPQAVAIQPGRQGRVSVQLTF
jgi:hypothetical protein